MISVRKCVFARAGGGERRCWCIEQSFLSLLKAFVSWGSLFITKPLVGRGIKTGCDPGVSPLTSVNPRGQISSNCAITISWPQGLWKKIAGARQSAQRDTVGKSGNLLKLRIRFKRGDGGSADMSGQRWCLATISCLRYCNICVLRDVGDQSNLTLKGHRCEKSQNKRKETLKWRELVSMERWHNMSHNLIHF